MAKMPYGDDRKTPEQTIYFTDRLGKWPGNDVVRLLKFQLSAGHLTERGQQAARNFLREVTE